MSGDGDLELCVHEKNFLMFDHLCFGILVGTLLSRETFE